MNHVVPIKKSPFLSFSPKKSIFYQWCGKYDSITEEWMHISRELVDYELFIITEGVLYIADSDSSHVVQKGEYFIMPPTKKQYGFKPSICSFYWMHFTLNSFQDEESLKLPFQGVLENMERIIILLHQLQDTSRRYQNKITSDLLCTGVFMEIYNQHHLLVRKQSRDLSSLHNQLYTAILDYVVWNSTGNIKVSQMASYFGYHEKYLSTFFKNISGISLKQYLLQEKMEHAKAELMETNKTISQIGYSLGFKDSHNFSNSFKKVTGLTPSDFRFSCLRVPKTP